MLPESHHLYQDVSRKHRQKTWTCLERSTSCCRYPEWKAYITTSTFLSEAGWTLHIRSKCMWKNWMCSSAETEWWENSWPIVYCSQTVTKQKWYVDAAYYKYFAPVWAILLLRPCSEDARLTLWTEHDALWWIRNLANAAGTLRSWRPWLIAFNFKIVRRARIKHPTADAVSKIRRTD